MDLLEKIARALGLNPIKVRWWLHRRQERQRQRSNERDNRRRVLSYAHKVCPGCGLTVDRHERRCPRCARPLASAAASRLMRVLRHVVPEGTYTLTSVFVTANVAFYLAMLLRSGGGPASLGTGISPAVMLRFGANDPVAVLFGGQPWRLVTAMFLHFDLLHLIFNSLCLIQLGPLIESALGRSRFVTLYVVGGVMGFVASTAAMFVRGPALSAGASGVVFGLIAAGLVLGYVKKVPGAQGFREGLVKWLVLGAIISFLPGVDLMAHAGGAAGGAAVAALTRPEREAGRSWLVAGIVCLCLTGGSVVAAWLAPGPMSGAG